MTWWTRFAIPTARRSAPGAALAALALAAATLGAPAAAQPAEPRGGEPGAALPEAAPEEETGPEPVAVLQGLDKVTARVSTFEAPLDEPVHFGSLEIVAHACRKRPPEEPPESAAFLEIREVKPGEAPAELFMGWMFASSPALSALEHPVYDIWVLDCRSAKTSASSTSE